MFAVIRTGGKQYSVEPGALLSVEKIEGEVGSEIKLNDVLLVGEGETVRVGKPVLDGVAVSAEIVKQFRGPKLTIFKKLKRHGHQLKKGHRQDMTQIRVTGIVG